MTVDDLERLRERRAAQGVRVANASRAKRERELEAYRALDQLVARAEAERRPCP